LNNVLFTIGHSNHSIEAFISLLQTHGLTSVADVRTQPYSRRFLHFSQDLLKDALSAKGIKYVFLGRNLGARSDNPDCYHRGKVQYDLLAQEPQFVEGLDQLRLGMNHYKIAIMCAEKDPLNCHRAVLVARKMFEGGISVAHIHADGSLEPHELMEARMLKLLKIPEFDMFRGRAEFLLEAYATQANRIAYQDETMNEVDERASL
jgi:uncharacterized protein (DUF488 family)